MRKAIVLSAALVLGSALLPGAPANAVVGCGCVKLGSAPMCVSGVSECMSKVGGLCLAPCDYTPAKKAMKKTASKKKTT